MISHVYMHVHVDVETSRKIFYSHLLTNKKHIPYGAKFLRGSYNCCGMAFFFHGQNVCRIRILLAMSLQFKIFAKHNVFGSRPICENLAP